MTARQAIITDPAAVLFDMDGLLLDSEPAWHECTTAMARRLGFAWGAKDQAHCIGGTIDATCRYIVDVTGTTRSAPDIQRELIADVARHFEAGLPVHDGATRLLDGVRARGVAVGLVSSSFRVLVDAALRTLGPDRFDVTVSGDEVRHGKPHPEPYLTACAHLGVEPARVVVVEDALNGVRSAEAAGCRVVAVPSVAPIPPAPRRRVAVSLADVTVDWLLATTGVNAATPPRSHGAHRASPPGAPATMPR
jgi:HAD superfamily hydrolase (TIGR01509 family)